MAESKGSMKGYLWDIFAPHLNLAYFFYDNGSRSQEVIMNQMEGYRGII